MSTLAQMISSAFPGGRPCPCSADEVPVARQARRRKLWELPHAYHCALIGTCLPVPDMRRRAPHSGYDVSKMTDYSLHTVMVGYCEERSALTTAIQRFFDKRHAQAVARFAPATDTAAIAFLWHEALKCGDDIPGALWAAWTHPATDDELGRDIHGDIHMLSHQVGTAVRADLRQLEHYKREADRLRGEAAALRQGLIETHRAHEKAVAVLRREFAAAQQHAPRAAALERELAAVTRERRKHADLKQRAAMLAARAEVLEKTNSDNANRAAQLDEELAQAREALATTVEAIIETPACSRDCPPGPALKGRCILCVGGRSGLVDGYRRQVETRGGRFLHHDGGKEEHLHRIDAAIANADAVICQTACVSHAAYWRLKDTCKKLGKPCVFVQSPGVGSFARSLSALVNAAPTDQVIRISA